ARNDLGFVAVVREGRLHGVVYVESVLRWMADARVPEGIESIVSLQIPTCRPQSLLVDAVRQMLAYHVRRIPVIDETGLLLGLLPLAVAAAAAERDPAVRDALEGALTPSLFARGWH